MNKQNVKGNKNSKAFLPTNFVINNFINVFISYQYIAFITT